MGRWALSVIVFTAVAASFAHGDLITREDLLTWHDGFDAVDAWRGRPDWQPNPDAEAVAAVESGTGHFVVHGPDKGMKWTRAITPVGLDVSPYLIVRYRARGINTHTDNYFIYCDDKTPNVQCCALRLNEVVADGLWHTVFTDMRLRTAAPLVDAVALQVQTGASTTAEVWVDEIGFAEWPPQDADRLGEQDNAAKPLLSLFPLLTGFTAQPLWLANPAAPDTCAVEGAADGTYAFAVRSAGRGMKWSAPLAGSVSLKGYRYLVLEYRGTGLRPQDDYSIALLSSAQNATGYAEVVRGRDLIGDGLWRG